MPFALCDSTCAAEVCANHCYSICSHGPIAILYCRDYDVQNPYIGMTEPEQCTGYGACALSHVHRSLEVAYGGWG